MGAAKYRPFLETNPISLPDRAWPNRRITKAPRWLSTDLRDGNQSLVNPMDPGRKRVLFDKLVQIGFQEIEVGFPAASQPDFDFVRSLIDEDVIPENVTISVLTQSREDLIRRTFEALRGAHRANVHLYNAVSPLFRKIVFRNDKPQTVQLARQGVEWVMREAEAQLGDETIFGFQYSPEIFMDTEPEFALEVCEAVMDVWQPGPEREIILNLPTTVERSTPNVYADQIEYMSRNLTRREYIALSVHTHNDRGTGVASAELAQLAGADRVEGCLFGQGERTGNVDLVTLALNLYTQGVDPQLDLSDIDDVVRVYEYCSGMTLSPRVPYAGELVYTSFSGSHQDAIKKGFAAREAALQAAMDPHEVPWEMPYLPIDPHDVGRNYEAVVRVNSQSGKGGVAFVLSSVYNLELPRKLQVEFSRVIQRASEIAGGELAPTQIWRAFADEYLPASSADDLEPWGRFVLGKTSVTADSSGASLKVTLFDDGQAIDLESTGNGPVDAFVKALLQVGWEVSILDYQEHAMGSGRDATAASYVEAEIDGEIVWGVGIDPSIARATYKAVISAMNRAVRAGQKDVGEQASGQLDSGEQAGGQLALNQQASGEQTPSH